MAVNKVRLRQLHQLDIAPMARLANNKNIWDNVRDYFPHPYSEKDAEEFIERQKKNDAEEVFAIEYNNGFCGCIGLIFQNGVYNKSAELGYWVGEPFWNKGIATKAIELIAEYGFKESNLVRIYAGVFEYNIGSMKALEKNGFQKEGIAKKAVFKNGRFWNEHRYALLC